MKHPGWFFFGLMGLFWLLQWSCAGRDGMSETTLELEVLVGQEKVAVSESNKEAAEDVVDAAEHGEPPLFQREIILDTDSSEDGGNREDISEPESGPGPDAAEEPEGAGVEPSNESTSEPIQEVTAQEPQPDMTECPADMLCVQQFPYQHDGDTRQSALKRWNRYNCQTSADESGPEVIYRVDVQKAGFLSAAVYAGSGVDVDVHILSQLDPNKCLSRGDKHARADVQPGIYYVVVDTFVSGGRVLSGKYRVDIGLYEPSRGSCGMQTGTMKRVNDGGNSLTMPATGPIVMEAHLVTQDEPPPYPSTATDELANHYDISQKKTGFVMHRTQVWAPLEGGSFYGAGIGSPTLFPLLHESWYVNMYWRSESRPARGTRMILRIPGTSRAVVVAAGYETGPGDLNNIGGTTEETHFYLGTGHKSTMTLGIATDQNLPFGPRICQ